MTNQLMRGTALFMILGIWVPVIEAVRGCYPAEFADGLGPLMKIWRINPTVIDLSDMGNCKPLGGFWD